MLKSPTQEIQNFTNPKSKYLISKLQEEAAEVIQAVSKINRFGETNSHPERSSTNIEELVGEIEDFLAIVGALESLQYFDLNKSKQNIVRKAQSLLK